jgi:hypothetical protein
MKKWILNWLGLAPSAPQEDNRAVLVTRDNDQLFYGTKQRNMFEVIPAVNGQIVVYNRRIDNPNGPDKNDMEVYIVQPGEDLMETIKVAIVSAKLK